MPVVKFIEADGNEHEVRVSAGTSVMQAALDNLIDGILAECGGSCACATCHCYVDDAWVAATGEAGDVEKGLLDSVDEPQKSSRLSCQIEVTEEMNGLVVRLPASQG